MHRVSVGLRLEAKQGEENSHGDCRYNRRDGVTAVAVSRNRLAFCPPLLQNDGWSLALFQGGSLSNTNLENY